MHIDWFVLFAQIVNFLILVFLLKHFLYGRIVNAMDAREARIAARNAEAEQLKEKARQAAEDYQQKKQALQAQTEELLNQARSAAETTRQDLLAKARAEVDDIQQRWYDTLSREKQSFLEDLRRRAGTHVYDTIRRVMRDLAEAELEDRILGVFLRLLKESDAGRLALIRENLAQADPKTGVILRSSFELTTAQQDRIIAALESYAPEETPIKFEISREIISGIELMAHGHKISWSINDYLADLEETFNKALKEEIPTTALT